MISTATNRPKTIIAQSELVGAKRKERSGNPIDSLCRRLVLRKLKDVVGGSLTLVEGANQLTFGDHGSNLSAMVFVNDSRFYRRLVRGGNLGVAESLMAGEWSCDNLTALVRIFIQTEEAGRDLNGWSTFVRRQTSRLAHWLRSNSISRARRNIQQHYDLGNDFYRLWLDDTMSYSSGIFKSQRTTMREASIEKIDRMCRHLDLGPSDHLLEIGTGWGALALHAAREYGCRVTTTTISDEQHELASRRISAAGLNNQITLLKKDYRQLSGRYDKIVSVEMIEAVGHAFYDTFFNACSRLLNRNGMMMLQAIVIADQYYDNHIRSTDFISQYIFPGGSLPSVSVLTSTAAKAAGMRILRLHDFAPHYAETLRRWREQFYANVSSIRDQGFDERFIRMWEYYLCYCEAAFDERRVNVVQMLFAQRGCKHDSISHSHESKSVGFRDANRFETQVVR